MGMVDSETCAVLRVFTWHQGKVRTLLVMPREVEACLCAEVPIVDQSDPTSADPRAGEGGGMMAGNPRRGEDEVTTFPTDNPLFVPNAEPDACMVTSIGNGRRQFTFSRSTCAKDISCSCDMHLLTWKS